MSPGSRFSFFSTARHTAAMQRLPNGVRPRVPVERPSMGLRALSGTGCPRAALKATGAAQRAQLHHKTGPLLHTHIAHTPMGPPRKLFSAKPTPSGFLGAVLEGARRSTRAPPRSRAHDEAACAHRASSSGVVSKSLSIHRSQTPVFHHASLTEGPVCTRGPRGLGGPHGRLTLATPTTRKAPKNNRML